MLAEQKLQQLLALIHTSSAEELIWINDYVVNMINKSPAGPETSVTSTAVKKITLLFGTETGNSKRLATQLATSAKHQGIVAKIAGLDQYRVTDLEKEEYLFVIISTHGEGEPPETARNFFDYIYQQQLVLPQLKYGVLALGDTSYPLYCKTGEDLDTRLHEFGATRVVTLQKCDVDYEEDAQQWFNDVLATVKNAVATLELPVAPQIPAFSAKKSAKKQYEGNIIANINLNDTGSAKQTHHIEIAVQETLVYEPGDALAIVPGNRKDVVSRIIQVAGVNPNSMIQTAKFTDTVQNLLTHHLNICFLLSSTMKKYAAIIQQDIPDIRMDLVDLLRIYPVKDVAQFIEIIKILTPVAPRLYSIASSIAAHGNEIHITVARNRFLAQDEQRYGLCSEFLGDQPIGTKVQFYIHKNRNFRLPPMDADIIMIGPGTGVAPFRSFLAERNATGATGKNWFFFGEQHVTSDFLYQTEMQQFAETGVLTRIDLAFSRDQAEKIYVQHRMLENAAALYEWIIKGAFVYISGTKHPMSKDVEETLVAIIAHQGNMSTQEANKFINQLEDAGRYEKDVY